MKEIRFEVDGRLVKGFHERVADKDWFHVGGRTFSVELEVEKKRRGRRGQQVSGTPGEIKAPMPGKITKVMANRGASIVEGQAILTMEAMKMEYTLKSDTEGVLVDLPVQVGNQVQMGDLLARVEKEAES